MMSAHHDPRTMPAEEWVNESEPPANGRDLLQWWSVGALALVLAWGASTLTWPAPPDAGVFAWLVDVLERGGVPYRDAFEQKGPTAWWPIALVRAITHLSFPVALHLTDLLFLVLGMVGVHRLARRVASPAGALAAAAVAGGWWGSLGFTATVQPDAWAGAVLAWCLLLAWRRRTMAALVAGLLLGGAVAVKPTYLAMLGPLLVVCWPARGLPAWLRDAEEPLSDGGWQPPLALGAGVLVTVLLVSGWLWWMDALPAFIDTWRWAASAYQYGEPASVATRLVAPLGALGTQPAAYALPLLLIAWGEAWYRGARRTVLALLGWCVAIIIGIAYQERYWPYHWHPFLPACAVTLALLLPPGLTAPSRRAPRALALALVLLLAALTPARQVYRWARAQRSAGAQAAFSAREFGESGTHPGSTLAIADSLLRPLPPQETLLVWGFHAGVAPILGHPAATRFPSLVPLYVGDPADARRRAYRTEMAAALRAHPPAYLLVASPAAPQHAWSVQDAPFDSIPTLSRWRDSVYEVSGERGGWVIHRRRAR